MTDRATISPEIIERLQSRAEQAGCSVNELLGHLLDSETDLSVNAAREQAIQAMWESENRLRQAMNLAHLGIWEWDIATDKTTWHGDMFRIYGITREEFTGVGSDYIGFTREDYREAQSANIGAAFEKGVSEEQLRRGVGIAFDPKELCIVRPDGTEAYTIGDAVAITDDAGNPKRMLGVSMDITERKLMEVALRQSEARLRSLVETQSAFVLRTDVNGKYTYVNDAFRRLYRWVLESEDAESLIGLSALLVVLPEDRETVVATIQTCITLPSAPVQITVRMRRKNGSIVWSLWELVGITNDNDEVVEIQGIGFDITEVRHAEQLKSENERLKTLFEQEQSQNALVQHTISTLAHDLRTPLSVISSAQDMLLHYFDQLSAEKRKQKLDSIGRQLQYALELLDDTVDVVKGNLSSRDFHPVPTNLAVLCRVSVEELGMGSQSNHSLRFVNTGQVDMVLIDEILVSRILLNLLSNAIKYSPDGGEIVLELQQREDWVVLSVVDQGAGISSSDLPHIFDPFFRAKATETISGTGLGLSIVKDCVERHQGRIHVESTPGQGTTFTVELPIDAAAQAHSV